MPRRSRGDIIEALIRLDLDSIDQMVDKGDYWWLTRTLREGFKGYDNMSYAELEQELRERMS